MHPLTWTSPPPDVIRAFVMLTGAVRTYAACSVVCHSWAAALTPMLREEAEIELLIRQLELDDHENSNFLPDSRMIDIMYPSPTICDHERDWIFPDPPRFVLSPDALDWMAMCEEGAWAIKKVSPEHVTAECFRASYRDDNLYMVPPADLREPLPAQMAHAISEFLLGSRSACNLLANHCDREHLESWQNRTSRQVLPVREQCVSLEDALRQASVAENVKDLLWWEETHAGGTGDPGLDRTPRQESYQEPFITVFREEKGGSCTITCRGGGGSEVSSTEWCLPLDESPPSACPSGWIEDPDDSTIVVTRWPQKS
jgi:hypothetical protein